MASKFGSEAPSGSEGDKGKFLHEAVKDAVPSKKESDVFDKFVVWLKENGAVFPKLELRKYTENVRGVHCTCALSNRERIILIPEKLLIHDAFCSKTECGRAVVDGRVPLCSTTLIHVVIFMLYDMKSGDSFFQPYYDILPADFNNFPIFWTPTELEELKGSSLIEEIATRKENIRSDYDAVCRAFPDFAEFGFERFLWCRTAVGSRNFAIDLYGQRRTAMVPLADMLNHYRPRETVWEFDDDQDGFTVVTLKGVESGAQVMDSYGRKCNSKFLLHYGFTIEHNREADNICSNELSMIIKNPGMRQMSASITVRVTLDPRSSTTKHMFAFLRYGLASEEQVRWLNLHKVNNFNLKNGLGGISFENEVRVLKCLKDIFEEQLAKYPRTMEEDDALLRGDTLEPFTNKRHAVIIVRGEKEIASFYATLHSAIAELFPSGEEADVISYAYRLHGQRTLSDLDRYILNLSEGFEEHVHLQEM